MKPERARQILLGHAFMLPDLEDPLMRESFLLSLRPYKGLKRDKCAQIEEAFRVVAPELAKDEVDRVLVSALWGILWSTRNWALHPNGMLHRNHLISPQDLEWLEEWVAKMDYGLLLLFDGGSLDFVFSEMDACELSYD